MTSGLAGCDSSFNVDAGSQARDTGGQAKDLGAAGPDSAAAKTSYKTCIRTCQKASDCCSGITCVPGSHVCSQGMCKALGCKTDKDCGGGRTCKQVSITSSYSMGICEDWCTTDSQCSAPEKCIYSNKALPAKTCGQPCTLDLQCKTHEICKDKKFCDAKAINCKSNPDCTQVPWLDVCDVKSGMCGCSSTKICEKAITLIGGNPKCVYISF